MAASIVGPSNRDLQPDPIITNAMTEAAANGGWIADNIAPVKSVLKDYVRYGVRDAQTLLSALVEAMRAPGEMPNRLSRPITAWLTALIEEQALRVEIPREDFENSPSPEMPLMDAGVMIQNGLRAAIESLVKALLDPTDTTSFPLTGAKIRQVSAAAPWTGSGTQIELSINQARIRALKNGGVAPNVIVIPPEVWPAVWATDEVQKAIGAGYRQDGLDRNGGLPPMFFGLIPLVPGMRTDTVPTGTFTPAFVWGAEADGSFTARLLYTPSPQGQAWNGSDPTALGQFENQTNGTAFEARQMPDPYYEMNGLTQVFGNVRRSAPKALNLDLAQLITNIG